MPIPITTGESLEGALVTFASSAVTMHATECAAPFLVGRWLAKLCPHGFSQRSMTLKESDCSCLLWPLSLHKCKSDLSCRVMLPILHLIPESFVFGLSPMAILSMSLKGNNLAGAR